MWNQYPSEMCAVHISGPSATIECSVTAEAQIIPATGVVASSTPSRALPRDVAADKLSKGRSDTVRTPGRILKTSKSTASGLE